MDDWVGVKPTYLVLQTNTLIVPSPIDKLFYKWWMLLVTLQASLTTTDFIPL